MDICKGCDKRHNAASAGYCEEFTTMPQVSECLQHSVRVAARKEAGEVSAKKLKDIPIKSNTGDFGYPWAAQEGHPSAQ